MLEAESLRPTSAVAGGPGAGCATAWEELVAGAGGAAGGGLGRRSHASPSLSGKLASKWGYEPKFGWPLEEVSV